MNHLVDQVEAKVFSKEEREIPSSYIGELVMRYLEEPDAVAYVRFASIYREFKDVDTFMEELKDFRQITQTSHIILARHLELWYLTD